MIDKTPMAKILINATSCRNGGAVQVVDGLIRTLLRLHPQPAADLQWIFALSKPVYESVRSIMTSQLKFEVLDDAPGDFLKGYSTRRRLLEIERHDKPDLVFTVFGPSYVRFRAPELMGFANAFMIQPGLSHYANHPWCRIVLSMMKKYLRVRYVRSAAALWVETKAAKDGIAKFARIAPDNIHVVPNSVNPELSRVARKTTEKPTDLVFISAAYWHKNHLVLPRVAACLERMNIMPDDWRFSVTIDTKSVIWSRMKKDFSCLGLLHRIHNYGPVPVSRCADVYAQALLLVHPSLLEVFSATYLEAMWFGVPIAASDRPFAREVCGDAAVYFDPLNPESIAQAIASVVEDSSIRRQLVLNGERCLGRFPSPNEKYETLVNLAIKLSTQTSQ